VHGARYRSGAQGQDIDLFSQVLEPFLVGYAETLFLIDDDKTKVFELNIALQ
jgi:hypothetical protein